ncbi:MAG TPA: putative sulfate exporter family transporter [Stellaceae bacterium]|jgi:uncharacterized integral membrane protein (TIGR00698 family)|nr:putative sulfate exporter family transporter [Stellaceae bacterium]
MAAIGDVSTNRPAQKSAALRPVAVGLGGVLPGVLLCVGVTIVATLLEWIETQLTGRAWVEALVLAILVGTAVRTAWTPGQRWSPGIGISAKLLLEIAIVLLGASLSAGTMAAAGLGLFLGVLGIVAVAIAASYAMGRAFGLPHRMATLIACGNSICGNSAIAAVAPVIGASGADIVASIAFTAVLGVFVVLTLPLAVPLLHLSESQYGVLAGLTVYAVPQVLAATAPAGAIALQIGTLVKLVRVLTLGPVVLGLSVLARYRPEMTDTAAAGQARKPGLRKLVPWFIIGFLAMAGLRSAGLLPQIVLIPAATAANVLTIIAMAALGLSTDLRVVARAGGRVAAVVTLSLLVLGGISLGLIRVLGIA